LNTLDRLTIQDELDSLKTPLERNILGQFATPPSLAKEILECAVSYLPEHERITFLEPALGTGAFYEALTNNVNGRLLSATGVEIDPPFAEASKRLWAGTRLTVVNEDFTKLKPGAKVNLLVTNPPYVRHHHIEAEHKKALVRQSKAATGIAVSGLSGLYVHFMMLAHRWLAEGAVSAWLIPSEFMDVNYGEGLKRYLTERVQLLRIHRFCPEDVQFDDALVTSTVLFFRNAEPSANERVSYTFGPSIVVPSRADCVTVDELRNTRKWSSLPRVDGPAVEASAVLLGDAFTIRRGLATGDNSFFIRRLSEFDALGIPREFLKPILPAPRSVKVPVVVGDADGYPELEPKMALLDCPLPDEAIERDYPALWSYLEQGKENNVSEGYLAKSRKAWYFQEKREPPPILCTYMGRQREGEAPFRFIENRSRAVATNVYLLLYPKPWVVAANHDGLLISRVSEYLRTIGAKAFIAEGRVYGGGLHKMEPKELARLPLEVPELTVLRPTAQTAFDLYPSSPK